MFTMFPQEQLHVCSRPWCPQCDPPPIHSRAQQPRLFCFCCCRQQVHRDGAHLPQAPAGARRAATGAARPPAAGGWLGRERQRLREEIQQEKGSQGEGSALQVSMRLRGSVRDVGAAGSTLRAHLAVGSAPVWNDACFCALPNAGRLGQAASGRFSTEISLGNVNWP